MVRASGVARPAEPARQAGHALGARAAAAGAGPVNVRRWLALCAYTALLYGLLPFGPAIGRAVQASEAGRWLLGSGAVWIVLAGVVATGIRLRRRAASATAWTLAGAAVLGYALALLWLRAIRLERVHLPEYGLASALAWWALVRHVGDRGLTYVAAALVAAAIGWGDELVQAVTPGRVYDLRDVAANALGAALGALVIAVWRAEAPVPPIDPRATGSGSA